MERNSGGNLGIELYYNKLEQINYKNGQGKELTSFCTEAKKNPEDNAVKVIFRGDEK